MTTEATFAAQIRRLLQSKTVMSLKQIRQALSHRPRSSLFRDLKKLDLITSYTHAGQFHALKSAARFDAQGLWFFESAGFSKYGTLKNTLSHLISQAPTGMTQKELKSLLRIPVQNTLTHLVKTHAVGRQVLPDRIYVYLSITEHQAAAQLERRLAVTEQAPKMTLPPESLIIEILLELIRASRCQANTQTLGKRLRQRGIGIADAEIVYVLTYYDIKKNGP